MFKPTTIEFFKYQHLPAHLQTVSKPFAELAATLANELPDNEESQMAMRKLLEAKDCAVRALLVR